MMLSELESGNMNNIMGRLLCLLQKQFPYFKSTSPAFFIKSVNRLIIAVDAGHGGINEGAIGITGKAPEKNYTLRFANELEKVNFKA